MTQTFMASQVLCGTDDWLFYADENSLEDLKKAAKVTPKDIEDWDRQIRDRHTWLRQQGIPYRFAVIPDKHTVYGRFLPDGYRRTGTSRLDTIEPHLRKTGVLVDFRADLLKHANAGDNALYFRTGTELTSRGAYIVYRHLMASLTKELHPETLCIAQFVPARAERRDLAWMAQIADTEPDSAPAQWTSSQGSACQVMVPLGLDTSSIRLFSAYTCPAKQHTALVFHDSCAIPLLPYLHRTFRRVICVWGHPNDEIFVRLVQQERPDVVIEERVERYMRIAPLGRLSTTLERLQDEIARGFTTEQLQMQSSAYALLQGNARLMPSHGEEVLMLDAEKWTSIGGGYPEAQNTAANAGGKVESLSVVSDGYRLSGWVGFTDPCQSADYIVLATGPRIAYLGQVDKPCQHIAGQTHLPYRAGFCFVVPTSIVQSFEGPVRVFSLKQRDMVELTLAPALAASLSHAV
jgi:alginate O-acetyltransferase complex protein AlgJ